eukprot:gene9193-4442_t
MVAARPAGVEQASPLLRRKAAPLPPRILSPPQVPPERPGARSSPLSAPAPIQWGEGGL